MGTKTLRIELKPIEPYFFGDDRSLRYKGLKEKHHTYAASYFSKSEETPLQSTLFGTLRYLGIQEKSMDFRLTQEDISNIGKESFQIGKETDGYGKIIAISNLFLSDADKNLYVRMPKDAAIASDKETKIYETETNTGKKYLPYINLKDGFLDGYMCVETGKNVPTSEIFKRVTRTGIHTKNKKEGYFKKEYCYMENYGFVFFATVEASFPEIKDKFVKMGQGNSIFSVSVTEETEPTSVLLPGIAANPDLMRVVLLSDTYVKDIKTLNQMCAFAITETRDYRAFQTVYNAKNQKERYKKESTQLKLLKAGSVYWIEKDKWQEVKALLQNPQVEIAGFNKVIVWPADVSI